MAGRPHARARLAARATLTDVAVRAGVSRQTASRVARGGAGVRPETQERVQSVIDELGYQPDVVARALKVGSAGMIGVLVHDLGRLGHGAEILAGLEEAAAAAGLGVCIARIGAFDATTVAEGIDRLHRTGCDGIVVMAPWIPDAESLRTVRATIPLVTTSQVEDFPGPSVHVDTDAAVRQVVCHLLELGHRTVHHVAGPEDAMAAALRETSWRRALRDAGAHIPEVVRGDWSADSGYRAGCRVAEDREVSAIFAANDAMALGVLHALLEHGVSIPDQVSVVGFDASPMSQHTWPPLTTVGFDASEHARRAVDALLRRIRDEEVDPIPPLSPTLIVRASSGRRRA
ncbi:LacI family DNA-binding transcriptional regulator [Brachybacterium sp. YJGR34]|uniref:LacI family DNA-binding transcriptional regulator n=1 Tax=Brachybacterium sp. YJGR34 TaxID=2059911 RepID=UPI000E0A7F77|nr:substrate-binding domain-containing protein [Brachybacterium sp. YJGR34]